MHMHIDMHRHRHRHLQVHMNMHIREHTHIHNYTHVRALIKLTFMKRHEKEQMKPARDTARSAIESQSMSYKHIFKTIINKNTINLTHDIRCLLTSLPKCIHDFVHLTKATLSE